jgi:type I restriction enzyme M protein
MSYVDYVEQFTYLLFFKMADERTKPPYMPASGAHKQPATVPEAYSWPTLIKKACLC